jgi:hypothetical protein
LQHDNWKHYLLVTRHTKRCASTVGMIPKGEQQHIKVSKNPSFHDTWYFIELFEYHFQFESVISAI